MCPKHTNNLVNLY